MGKQRQQWRVGDVFLVPNLDKKFTVGQIVAHETDVWSSVTCAFFDFRVNGEAEINCLQELSSDKIFSVQFVTRDLLEEGQWRIVCNLPVNLPTHLLPYEGIRQMRFIGAVVRGSATITEFLNAFYGLVAWDDWKKPNYLDDFLISLEKKPRKLIFKEQLKTTNSG